ncbi:MAG TPA: cytidine deaminase [Salinimicrobium sp.]|nr:cytidine deaminase [Salinimicrobium sp.]
MKKIDITAQITVFNSLEELPGDVQNLMEEAISAREKSYSPYSKFKVGAAIFLDNNEIVTGSNQENASYPAGLCAERTALFYAGAKYPKAKMLKLALSGSAEDHLTDSPIPPCGSCRQAISEYEVKQKIPVEIYFMGATGKIIKAESLSDLLPLSFKNSCL